MLPVGGDCQTAGLGAGRGGVAEEIARGATTVSAIFLWATDFELTTTLLTNFPVRRSLHTTLVIRTG
jgi:hypothetical protein